MRLRKILEKHTVVQLEDADAKLLQDMESRAAEKIEAGGEPHMLKVVESSLKAKLRLATVDNFQGNPPFLLIKRNRQRLFAESLHQTPTKEVLYFIFVQSTIESDRLSIYRPFISGVIEILHGNELTHHRM